MPIELSRFVGVRFRPDDYRQLEEKAAAAGVTVSDLIRHAALGLPPAPRRRQLADQDLINQLSRVGNNLNQQTRLFHQLQYRELLPEGAAVLAALEDIRRLLAVVSRAVAEASS